MTLKWREFRGLKGIVINYVYNFTKFVSRFWTRPHFKSQLGHSYAASVEDDFLLSASPLLWLHYTRKTTQIT